LIFVAEIPSVLSWKYASVIQRYLMDLFKQFLVVLTA